MGELHDRMREDLILKGYSPHTQNGYLRCARTFARHFMRSPEQMGEQEIREFLLHLVRDRKVSAATQDQYVNAIKFLYSVTLKRPETVKDVSHPKRPKTLPTILSPEEVLSFFEKVRSVKYKAIIATAYAAGLRIAEVCTLKVSDIDSARMRIRGSIASSSSDNVIPSLSGRLRSSSTMSKAALSSRRRPSASRPAGSNRIPRRGTCPSHQDDLRVPLL